MPSNSARRRTASPRSQRLDTPPLNPLVTVVFYEDDELAVEFCSETATTNEYHFDNPELMQGIADRLR